MYVEQAVKIAHDRDGKCFSTTCKTIKTKIQLICSRGHIWSTKFYYIRNGSWCPICAKTKNTIEDAIKLAESRNGECLSTEYIRPTVKLKWKCNENHIWRAKFGDVRDKKSWCAVCAHVKKLDISIANKIAADNNGFCLSTEYLNNYTKLKWQCSKGHIWFAIMNNIRKGDGSKGSWCPFCANKVKLTIELAKQIAGDNNGFCLSETYINCDSKLKWKCSLGHIFYSSMYDVKNRKHWCPSCKTSKNQRKLTLIINKIFGSVALVNYKGFSWLKTGNAGGKQEIDIYLPSLKLAIEYDGEQHFRPVRFGGVSIERAAEKFEHVKYLDDMKNKKIAKYTDDIKYFIRFNYKEEITMEYVIEKLRKHNVLGV